MKLTEILDEVNKHKTCSLAQLKRYLAQLEIVQQGKFRQRPANYPEDSATRILANLGITPGANGHAGIDEGGKVVSLKKLQTTRAAGRRGMIK